MSQSIRILGCTGGACGDLRSTALPVGDSVLVDCGSAVGDLTFVGQHSAAATFISSRAARYIHYEQSIPQRG